MPEMLFAPRPQPVLSVKGRAALYPVGRIFCVGRNYAAHAAEMGNDVDREAPFYFTKSAHALTQSGAKVPYALGTKDFHHEMELVVALGEGGAVFGYAAGFDMTRRDLQGAAKAKARPWDIGKDFEDSAVIAAITPAAEFGSVGPQRMQLSVNEVLRQDTLVADMVWSVPDILTHLGGLYTLGPGDVIMTGTPAGVGPVEAGDVIDGTLEGCAPVRLTILK